jgi:hypothetical protein
MRSLIGKRCRRCKHQGDNDRRFPNGRDHENLAPLMFPGICAMRNHVSMENFRYHLSIPPAEVMHRLGWAIETSGRWGLLGPTGEKRFIGRLTASEFSFRRWRWGHNTLASSCFGKVEPDGTGSVITGSVGIKYGCFLAFSIVFVLVFTLVPAGLVAMISLASAAGPADTETTHLLGTYWTVVAIIPVAVAAFLAAFFFLARLGRRSDEKELAGLFPSLFSDVLISKSG